MSDRDTLVEKYTALRQRRALTQFVLTRAAVPALDGESFALLLRQRIGRGPELDRIEKAATSALSSSDPGLDALQPLKAAWADLVRRQTLLGRMAAFIRRVPRHLPITVVDSSAAADFVTENDPIPVVRPGLTDASLSPAKIAAITPFTREQVRQTGDRIAVLVERDLARRVGLGEDVALLDGLAAVTGGRPASILAGLSPFTGGSPADLQADVLALLGVVRGGEAVAPFFITSPAGARYLIGVREGTGNTRVFPDVTISGGSIYGVTLLVSTGSPNILTLVDADSLLVVDDDDVRLDVATSASFQFDDAPSAGAATHVSLFQTNSVGIKIERYIAWRLAWADGAHYIELGVGSPGSPA